MEVKAGPLGGLDSRLAANTEPLWRSGWRLAMKTETPLDYDDEGRTPLEAGDEDGTPLEAGDKGGTPLEVEKEASNIDVTCLKVLISGHMAGDY